MAEAIRMPLLSDTMTEGVIAEWHKKVGDSVKADDVIAEVETDKATMEVMPYVDGTLLYIGVEKGQAVKVNGIMAIIGKAGEDYAALLNEKETDAPVSKSEDQPAEPTVSKTDADAPSAELPDGATVVRMPLLSDTMTEGKIVSWLKKEGDSVKADDIIAEVETDKATMELMPYVDGTLLHIGVPAGQAAKVNGIIAIIGQAGTDLSAFLAAEKDHPVGETVTKTTAAAAPVATVSDAPSANNAAEQNNLSRVKASPLARSIAKEKGINLNQLTGSGDHGRIIKRDLDNVSVAASPSAQGVPMPSASPVLGVESHEDIPLIQMRKVIAKRLSESKFNAPHFYLKITVKMDQAMASRKHINELSPVKVSFNDLIIKAVAMSLRQHPQVNSSWMGDFVRENKHIHVGTAVAVDEGLIVPVIKFADQLSLSQIAAESNQLIDKARNKKLQPHEFSGNTFTLSNLGMMDIDEFTAIINPPDSAILAIGKIEATPVVEKGEVVVRQLMKLTLSCDHRTVDGAVGSRFLQTLKAFLENPVTMLV